MKKKIYKIDHQRTAYTFYQWILDNWFNCYLRLGFLFFL